MSELFIASCSYFSHLCTFNIVQQLVQQILLHVRAKERRMQRYDALLVLDEEHLQRRWNAVVNERGSCCSSPERKKERLIQAGEPSRDGGMRLWGRA